MNIYDIIVKRLHQSASQEELNQLESWKNDSEENLKALEQMAKIHRAAEGLKSRTQYDDQQVWQNIQAATGLKDDKKKIGAYWAGSAAAILIFAFAALFLFKQPQDGVGHELFVTEQSALLIDLADGSNVSLDKNSTLQVTDHRTVYLKGRAEFDVTTTPDQQNFVVEIDGGKVTVLGTVFTILRVDGLLEVAVSEGLVRLEFEGRSAELAAGQVARLLENRLIVTPNTYENTNSWKTGHLNFKNEPLSNALKDISRHFQQNIVLDKSIRLKNDCMITSRFDDPSFDEILNELKTLFEIEVIKQNNTYVITSIKC